MVHVFYSTMVCVESGDFSLQPERYTGSQNSLHARISENTLGLTLQTLHCLSVIPRAEARRVLVDGKHIQARQPQLSEAMTHARCKLWSLVAVMVAPCAVVVSFAPLVHFGTVRGQQRLGVLAKNVLFATTDTSEKNPVSGFVDSMIETAWDLDAKVEKLVSGLRSSVDVSLEEEPISVAEPSSKKSQKPLVDSVIETAWDLDAKVEELVSGLHSSKTPALGDKFPNLVGSTQSTDSFDLYKYLGDNWGVVFMHPSECIY